MSCGCTSILVAQIEYSLLQEVASLQHSKLSDATICITHNYSTEFHLSQATPSSSLHKKTPPKYPHETALRLASHQYFWIPAEEMQLSIQGCSRHGCKQELSKINCIPLKCALCCTIRCNRKPKPHFWKRIFILGFISSFSDSNLFSLEG